MQIKDELNVLEQKLLLVTLNKLLLNNEDIKIYEHYLVLYNVLNDFWDNHDKKLKFIVRRFYGCNLFKMSLRKISIDEKILIKIHDLCIIDNLHDFVNERIDKQINNVRLKEFRSLVANFISDENIKSNVITKTCVHDVNKLREKIFKCFNMGHTLLSTSKIPLSHIDYNDVYFETPGIIDVDQAICPYKRSIDEASCNKDNYNIRDQLMINAYKKFNGLTIRLSNYDRNIIELNMMNNQVNLTINPQTSKKYYKYFCEACDFDYMKLDRNITEQIAKIKNPVDINNIKLGDTQINIQFSKRQINKIKKNLTRMIHIKIHKITDIIYSTEEILFDEEFIDENIRIDNKLYKLDNSVPNICEKIAHVISKGDIKEYILAGISLTIYFA